MKLWLSGVDERSKVQGVRALRLVAQEVGSHQGVKDAIRVWDAALRGTHILLATTDDPELMKRVTKILDDGDLRYQLTSDESMPVDEDPQDPEPIEEPEPEYVPTVQATQAAAVLLTQTDNPGDALATARALSRITQDPFWEDVAEYIIRTFPAPQQIMDVLLAARQS